MTRGRKQAIYLISAMALIGVMAFAYFFNTGDDGQHVEASPAMPHTTHLISRDETEVTRISFWQEGLYSYMEPFYDENDDLQWMYSPGADFLLNMLRTRDKARQAWALTVASVLHESTDGLDLSEFGLAPPRFVMEVSFYDGTSHTVRIGSQTTDMRHYFLMFDDDPAIYLITSFAAERIMVGVEELLEGSLPWFNFIHSTYFKISQRGRNPIEFALPDDIEEGLHFLHGTPPGWDLVMVQPIAGFESNLWFFEEVLTESLNNLRLANVVDVYPEDLAEFGLHDPEIIFEFHALHGEITLYFGDTFNEGGMDFVYVKIGGRPHVFSVAHSGMQGLIDLNPIDFVTRMFTLVNIIDIYAVTVTSLNENGNFEMFINHGPEDTRTIEPVINGVEVSDSGFRAMYQAMIGLLADAFIEPFAPTGEPDIIIQYHYYERDIKTVKFFSRDAHFYYVSINNGDIAFVTNKRGVEFMFSSITNLLNQ